jgi:3-phenylpropionate/trans-cinnamate dioxygenase ferredoxin reductase subunit
MADRLGVIVVVGAGLAGLRTVERLRHRGYEGRIVLLGAEPHLPYDRPPLSKQVLRGEREDAWLRKDNDYSGLDVEVRLDEAALGLDVAAGTVHTSNGELRYDVLVIATGAIPKRIPGIKGLTLRTLDDARRLRSALRPGARLAVIGAGLVGCEVAASARAMDIEVSLVDVLAGPLIRVLGAQVAHVVADLHTQHGVALHMNAMVAQSSGAQLTLGDGTVVAADVVLEAIGAVPDTAWLADSQLTLQDGVVCDEQGYAGPNVFAVGDVARWGGHRSEHWTNAGQQADFVSARILGQELPAEDVPYWWSDQYDLKLQGLGLPGAEDDVHLLQWGPKARTVALYSDNGALTGVVGFSAAAAIMKLRADIAAGTDVTEIIDRLTA